MVQVHRAVPLVLAAEVSRLAAHPRQTTLTVAANVRRLAQWVARRESSAVSTRGAVW